MRDGFKVIDADAHFYEPKDIWDKYVEPEYYDQRPRVARVLGKIMHEYEDGKSQPVARAKTLFSQMEAKFGHAFRDNWTLESRLKDMEQEGWDIQVCLPTNGGGGGGGKGNPGLAAALSRAYNNWANDFCSDASQRVKFTALVPGQDVGEMVKEAKRAVGELGSRFHHAAGGDA